MTQLSDILDDLNEAQRNAVTSSEGYIRVVAGAGSGKTRALTRRFAYLVSCIGILPENILCITFTNKAAFEMRQRIKAIIGNAFTGNVCTFHGFCVNFLRDHIHKLRYPSKFVIADAEDCRAMLEIIYAERHISMREYTFKDALKLIAQIKEKRFAAVAAQSARPVLADCRSYAGLLIHHSADEIKSIYDDAKTPESAVFFGFLYLQKLRFALDFHDIIQFTLDILDSCPDIRALYQEKFEYIMIDEFQDIDDKQYTLMKILCQHHNNLFIVGDPDQSIYAWRGAQPGCMLGFADDFPGAISVGMMQNYRSTPQILEVADSIISRNRFRIPKSLAPMRESGGNVLFHHDKNQRAEAEWIAQSIKNIAQSQNRSYRQFAILVRSAFLTAPLERALIAAEIPFQLQSAHPFFCRAVVKDAVSYLRMIVSQDDFSFERIVNNPKRNIGKQKLALVKAYARDHACSCFDALKALAPNPPFSNNSKANGFIALIENMARKYKTQSLRDTVAQVLDLSGYEAAVRGSGDQDNLDNLSEFKDYACEFEISAGEDADLGHFLTHIALFSRRDMNLEAEKVKVMTIHAAKGLEFPVVYVFSMAENTFPSRRCQTEPEIEQERRLAFVACTRAQDLLIFTDSELGSGNVPQYTSRFVWEAQTPALEFDPPLSKETIEAAKRNIQNPPAAADLPRDAFSPGDIVIHQILGRGTVVEHNFMKKKYIIRFDGLETLRTLSENAPIKRADDSNK